MPAKQAKNWCFTVNNYCAADKDKLTDLFEQPTNLKPVYITWGEEVGDSGTPHLQGFVSFNKKATFNAVKLALPTGAHLEVARGRPNQAAEYCHKDGEYTELGVLPGGSGSRSDLKAVQLAIKRGATQDEIRDNFFAIYCRYDRAINAYINDLAPKRSWKPTVIVLWGDAGVGKSRSVYDYHAAESIYSHPGEKWFDGYHGQPTVLFDDFNGGEFKLTYLLKLIDRYPMQVPIKGGYTNWVPKVIYFTSNKDPSEWYQNITAQQQRALQRRFSGVFHFTQESRPHFHSLVDNTAHHNTSHTQTPHDSPRSQSSSQAHSNEHRTSSQE